MSLPTLTLLLLPLLPLLPLTLAQDQCNLLPLTGHINLPLKTYIPHTNTTTNTTICNHYAPKNSTQYQWITQLINLAFTGDYPPAPNGTYQSQGILNPNAYYLDPCNVTTPINLVPYFNGTFRSSNRNSTAVSLNFLDGGSVPALRSNIPAWSNTTNQYRMMTGFYSYFSFLFGCSDGSTPLYTGPASQTSIHRFMDLPSPYIHYFIHSIVDAATTIGGLPGADVVTHRGDSISIGVALDNLFNKRCSPSQKVVGYQPAGVQGICADEETCARWTYGNATCKPYEGLSGWGFMPAKAGAGEVGRGMCAG